MRKVCCFATLHAIFVLASWSQLFLDFHAMCILLYISIFVIETFYCSLTALLLLLLFVMLLQQHRQTHRQHFFIYSLSFSLSISILFHVGDFQVTQVSVYMYSVWCCFYIFVFDFILTLSLLSSSWFKLNMWIESTTLCMYYDVCVMCFNKAFNRLACVLLSF